LLATDEVRGVVRRHALSAAFELERGVLVPDLADLPGRAEVAAGHVEPMHHFMPEQPCSNTSAPQPHCSPTDPRQACGKPAASPRQARTAGERS
jgi:hypothetical protein